MKNNRILNLPFPQTSGEPVMKGFAEMNYSNYLNILTFEGSPGNVTILHKDDMIDTPENGRATKTFQKLVVVIRLISVLIQNFQTVFTCTKWVLC